MLRYVPSRDGINWKMNTTLLATLLVTSRLINPGFETVKDLSADAWTPYEQGCSLIDEARSGRHAMRCANDKADDRRGAVTVLTLNQVTPVPMALSAWSRARQVSGDSDRNYALYVDVDYVDGSKQWGQFTPFSSGTHDWQKRELTIVPNRPIRALHVHVLFRQHAGVADFDDIDANELSADKLFDGQLLRPPHLPPGRDHAWFIRDVAAGSPLQPISADSPALGLTLTTINNGVRLTGAKAARAVTLYYVERLPAGTVHWWDDIVSGSRLGNSERMNVITGSAAGASGARSRYPYGCITAGKTGRLLGVPPTIGPRLVRIGAHGGAGVFYVAIDLGLTPGRSADAAIVREELDPAWGFRGAVARWKTLFPVPRRAKAEGIWIPFTDPAVIQQPEDFSIAYHEGVNAVLSDDRAGILSFRYTEPMTWWMPMPPDEPREYQVAYERLQRLARSGTDKEQQVAQATLTTPSLAPDGRINHEFRNEPWANGVVWVLNPNPALPGKFTKARLNWNPADAEVRYGSKAPGILDGEYLDSIEGWGEILDFRPESLAASTVPPTFSRDGLQPAIPTWFSVWEYTKMLSEELHRRNKLLFANSTPWRVNAFAPLLDVAGTEVDWMPGGKFVAEDAHIFALRRTLSQDRPYLLLQNTDLEAFGPYVERFFADCLAWGIYPGFFSQNASSNTYWENPRWYERDRPIFRKYLPVLKQLSAAGWESIPYARATDPDLHIERFGTHYWTVHAHDKEAQAELILDIKALRLMGHETAMELLSGKPLQVRRDGGNLRIALNLKAGSTLAVEVRK